MPVTVRLSKRSYDTFGEEIANEFVEWFNLVDTTYRSQIRDLFDSSSGRFDAKLEQRAAGLRADLVVQFERRIAALDGKAAPLDAKLEQCVAALRAEFRQGLATLEGRLVARIGALDGRFGALEGRLVRWMLGF